MLMVIFGAGASYDSAPSFPASSGAAGQWHYSWRPLLARHLFRDGGQLFGNIVARYPKLRQILPYLRQPASNRSVEEELESLQARSGPERKRELAAVAFYLRDLFFEISDHWQIQTSGVTNYSPLIREILELTSSEEPTCLVTFNYDLLLDRALVPFGLNPSDLETEYFLNPRLKLFKPHGSVNWARFIDPNHDTRRLHPDALCDQADRIILTNELTLVSSLLDAENFPQNRSVFPCIAIPVQNKTDSTFAWPLTHRKYFLELLPSVRKILIIGWQAREAHFLELLRSNLRGVTHLMVVGSDTADSQEILQRFASEIARTLHPKCTYYTGRGGFSRFVIDHEGEAFLSA